MKSTAYSIGDRQWPGLGKLAEECGEVLQVVGKLVGTGGAVEHWDGGPPLDDRLEEELGDLLAAIRFVVEKNGLAAAEVEARAARKLDLFRSWHGDGAPQ